jgi:hypothetical protein
MEKVSKRDGESKQNLAERARGQGILWGKGDTVLVTDSPAAVRTAFQSFRHTGAGAPKSASGQLISVLSLMRTDLINGQQNKPYAKSMFPLLAKTDFAKLFDLLPEAAYYRNNRADWLNLVLHCADMDGEGANPMLSGDIKYAAEAKDAYQSITRRGWILHILDGTDLLTQKGIKQTAAKEAAPHFFGMGSLGSRTDRVGAEGARTKSSAVVEFRRIAGSLDHKLWKDFAFELFDYVRTVNSKQVGSYKAKAPFGEQL